MIVSKIQQSQFRDKLSIEKITVESIKEEIKEKGIPQTEIARAINYSVSSVNNNLRGFILSYKVLYLINRYVKGFESHDWATNLKVSERNLTWMTQNGFSNQEAIAILT